MSSCADFDKAFRMAEQQISDRLVTKKFRLGQNAYWGRVRDEGMFPEKSGTQIKKIRLTRIGFGEHRNGWTDVVDTGCATNICADPEVEVMSHGSEEYFYGLQKFSIATDEICLALLPFRQMADKELAHFEESLQNATRYFWDEYLRSRYIHHSENKYTAFVDDDVFEGDVSDTCDLLKRGCNPNVKTDGFIFWNREPGTGETVLNASYPMDERYVSVNIQPSKVRNISELSGDLLESAFVNLEYEDDAMPLLDSQGLAMMEVLVPDVKVGRRLVQFERMQESDCSPTVIYPDKQLGLNLGIQRIIRDQFAIRRDLHGMKFYPDDAYNAELDDGSYSPTDPATWPRFRRVFAYVPARNANGTVKYVKNQKFINAPFGISVIYTPAVMGMRHHPEAKSYGSAKPGETARKYAGKAEWINEYDKKCNPNREKGHWRLNFGAGIEPDRPELGNVFFHRIDHSVTLAGNRCPIPLLGCVQPGMTNDCFNEVVTGEAALGLTAGDRGANVKSVLNSVKFYM